MVTSTQAETRSLLSGRAAGLTAVVLAALLWSVGAVVASSLFDRGVSPLELVEFRTYITAFCLGCLTLWSSWRTPKVERTAPPLREGWRSLLGFGLAIGVANASLFLAIKHLPVAVAMVLQNLAPAFVIILVLVTTRRGPSARMLIGMGLALAGVALVVQLPTTPIGEINLLGVVFGISTALAVAAFSIFGERAGRAYGSVRANTAAFVVSATAWMLIQIPQGMPDLLGRPELFWQVAVVGVFGTLAPFLLFAWGTVRLGSEVGALSISLEPVFSAAIAWVWLGEALTVLQMAGVVAIIVGIIHLQGRAKSVP